MNRTLLSGVLPAALVLVSAGAALACGINTDATSQVDGKYRAVKERWAASRPVSAPPLSRVVLADLDRRACWSMQRMLQGLLDEGLELCAGPSTVVQLLRAAAGQGTADRQRSEVTRAEAVRVPHQYFAVLDRNLWINPKADRFDDPGQGPGSCENYLFIQLPQRSDGWSRMLPFCLVHGGFQPITEVSHDQSPRAQLAALGVADPAILALAQDRLSPAVPRAALFTLAGLYALALAIAVGLAWRQPTARLTSTAVRGGVRCALESAAAWGVTLVHPAGAVAALVPLARAVPVAAAIVILVPRGLWWAAVARWRREPKVKTL